MNVIRRIDAYLLLTALLSVFAIAPLLNPGYFWGAHDARHSVYFLVEFDRSIQDGVLYPRWSPDINFGYGYPFFNIYSPLSSYAGEALHLLGLDFVAAVKAVFGLSFVLSALAMYAYARRALGSRSAALVAAMVYLYVPYRLADVFLRGALADSFCFIFFPLALLGFHELVERPRPKSLVLAGIGLAGLIFSHYPLALLFVPFLCLYILVLWLVRHWLPNPGAATLRRRITPLLWAFGGGVYAVALSAILLLPAVLEFRFVRTDQWNGGYYNYKDHFVYFFQFFAPTFGYGPGSLPGPHDTLPFQFGVVAIVLAALSLLAVRLLRRARQAAGVTPLLLFYQIATAGLMFLMLGVSLPIWEKLGLVAFAQFPWRLLSIATLTVAVLSGALLVADEERRGEVPFPILAALLAIVILGSYSYLQPQIVDAPEGGGSVNGMIRFMLSSGEMTAMTSAATRSGPLTGSPLADVYVSGGVVNDKVMHDQLAPGVQAVTTYHSTTRDDVRVSAPQATTIGFYTSSFPGWHATVDGSPVALTTIGDAGAIAVPVPAGEHNVVLRFDDTWPRTVGMALTLLSVVVGFAIIVFGRPATPQPRIEEDMFFSPDAPPLPPTPSPTSGKGRTLSSVDFRRPSRRKSTPEVHIPAPKAGAGQRVGEIPSTKRHDAQETSESQPQPETAAPSGLSNTLPVKGDS